MIKLANEHLGYYFKRINEAFVARANKSLKKFELTSTQMDILMYLFRNNSTTSTQRDIEKYFNLSHSTVIGVLQRLTEKGYITVEQSLDDKRQRNVNLTQKAFEVKQYILNHRQKIQNSFAENFSESELESLVKSLKKVYDILQKECEK